jgi:hypothetical protein
MDEGIGEESSERQTGERVAKQGSPAHAEVSTTLKTGFTCILSTLLPGSIAAASSAETRFSAGSTVEGKLTN